MPRKRVRRSAEYKQEALRIVDGKEPVATVADDLGLARETLYRWVREYRANPSEAFRGNGNLTSQDEELRKLRQENARLKEERDIFKKSHHLLCKRVTLKYALIKKNRRQFRVSTMCRVLNASKGGFYAWLKRPESRRKQRDRGLCDKIASIFKANKKRYGAPRVHVELRKAGESCGRKRVARLMREANLVGRRRRRFVPKTTDSNHKEPIAENVLDRRFSPESIASPNRCWAGDISVLQQHERRLTRELMSSIVQEAA